MIIAILTDCDNGTKAFILRDLNEVNRLHEILPGTQWKATRIYYYPNYLFPQELSSDHRHRHDRR